MPIDFKMCWLWILPYFPASFFSLKFLDPYQHSKKNVLQDKKDADIDDLPHLLPLARGPPYLP